MRGVSFRVHKVTKSYCADGFHRLRCLRESDYRSSQMAKDSEDHVKRVYGEEEMERIYQRVKMCQDVAEISQLGIDEYLVVPCQANFERGYWETPNQRALVRRAETPLRFPRIGKEDELFPMQTLAVHAEDISHQFAPVASICKNGADDPTTSHKDGIVSMLLSETDSMPDAFVGGTVTITGLVYRPELNHSSCALLFFDNKSGRWAVKLRDGTCIKIKSQNLQGRFERDQYGKCFFQS
eukprot:gnl/MRDRNA2_/MRDRNA2_181631_c0_seq1.p1 gnl/MRDRNA2_/MRDRNA2_181631_c0~~gnl/MRDRNA2_/MRDRNA2_181631_c0_seq1.p1  ORF type:complete len:239 (+),score=32.87 gnl/MRDRNA2_/MRDRNA2_181631_c0_seq1:992-1708(+)